MRNVFVAIIVALSMLGYLNFMINKKMISMFIAPVFLITMISMSVYCAGLINIMPFCVYMIVIVGNLLLLRDRKSISVSFLRGNSFPVVLCMLLVAYLLYLTVGGNYSDGDTMTHWGVIVKSIYRYDRLPNFLNFEIGYQSYPPVTACWIYFMHRLFGYGEGRAMFAQGLWMLSCVISLFAANKTRKKSGDLLIFLTAFYLLRDISSLRVDIILSLVVIAAMVVIMEEKNNPDRMVGMLLPFLFVIPLIKNSGLLFAYYLSAVAVCITFKGEKNREKSIKENCLYMLFPIASKFLWDAHIEMVYSEPNTSRHSMSVDYLQNTFGEKSIEEINLICDRFISRWFSNNASLEWWALLLLLVVFIIAFFAGSRKKELTWTVVISISFYLIYKIGLLMMYLTNMPGADALKIASYDRYQTTFTIIQFYVVLIVYLEYIQTDEVLVECQLIKWFVKPMCKIALILLMVFMLINFREFKHPDYVYGGVSRIVKTLTKEVPGFDVGDKVLVYHSYYFNGTFTGWALDNDECRQTYDLEEVQAVLTANEENFEWLLILEGEEEIQDLLQHYDYKIEGELVRLVENED